ncbi:hypothetical protein [Synechococcus sp. MIT S9507]|uniref:hypothetical protein n=1 Tax=Synechococcus sp. MIT S9507 TaxID=3082544 RepID=UPI0039B5AFDF
MVCRLLLEAERNSNIPLSDFIVDGLQYTTTSELDELVKLATRTHRDSEVNS